MHHRLNLSEIFHHKADFHRACFQTHYFWVLCVVCNLLLPALLAKWLYITLVNLPSIHPLRPLDAERVQGSEMCLWYSLVCLNHWSFIRLRLWNITSLTVLCPWICLWYTFLSQLLGSILFSRCIGDYRCSVLYSILAFLLYSGVGIKVTGSNLYSQKIERDTAAWRIPTIFL